MRFPSTSHETASLSRSVPITVRLLTFFALSFLIAWGTWIPLFIRPSLPRQTAFIGLFAPAMAALLTAVLYEGKPSAREVVRRLTIVTFSPRWAVLSALIMPAIYLTALGVLGILKLRGPVPLFAGNSSIFIVAGFVWLMFITSGEELGWRGYALPRLLEYSDRPVLVSIGLGLVWGLWHLPLYLLPGQSAFPLPLFLIFTILQCVLYTVVFVRTKGSLLPAVLLHAGTDIAPRVFQLPRLPSTFWIIVDLVLGLVVTGLLIAARPLEDSQLAICISSHTPRSRSDEDTATTSAIPEVKTRNERLQ